MSLRQNKIELFDDYQALLDVSHLSGWIHSQGRHCKQKGGAFCQTTQLLQGGGLGSSLGFSHTTALSWPFPSCMCMLLCLPFLLCQTLLSQQPQIGASSILQTSIRNFWYHHGTGYSQCPFSSPQYEHCTVEDPAPATSKPHPAVFCFRFHNFHWTI